MNTSWKEKTSIFGIRCGLALVVGLAKVMKPALDIVLSYKQKWQNELNSVFDNVDIPLKNIQTINELKKITVRCIACNKTKELCNCCDIEQKVPGKGEWFSWFDQKAVIDLTPISVDGHKCCGCLGDPWCDTCPVHGIKTQEKILGDAYYIPSIQTNEMKQEYIDTSKTQKQVSKKAPPKNPQRSQQKRKLQPKLKRVKYPNEMSKLSRISFAKVCTRTCKK